MDINANLETDGFSREVFLINGQSPGPLIEADEGDDLEIFVKNDLPVDTTIHWHGKLSYRLLIEGSHICLSSWNNVR